MSITDSIINTALWNKWRSYKLDIKTVEPAITKKLLYNLCMTEILLAFTYDIVRSKKSKQMMVIFKVLPHPKYGSLKHVWNKYYVDPQELTNLELDFNVYICKEIILQITASEVMCPECGRGTVQAEAYCINEECVKFTRNMNHLKYISNKEGKILKTLEDLLSDKKDTLLCKQCLSCRICQKMNGKCKRHKVCKHLTKNKQYFHILNKLAYEKYKVE